MVCRVKICGVTCIEDADLVVQSGADAIGVNLIPSSKRFVGLPLARAIVDRVRDRLLTVLVLADPTAAQARELRAMLRPDYLQLHGNESPADLQRLLPGAFKAVRIGAPQDVADAEQYPGELLLADAKVPCTLGGSGVSFDWSLVEPLARRRSLILAGGLTAENVADAIRSLRPWGVDVASGVEDPGTPRRKSPDRVSAFLTAVRGADIEQHSE